MNPLPASAVRVLDVLTVASAPLSLKDLREQTGGMKRRTLFHATRRLMECGLVRRLPALKDARRAYFSVSTASATQPRAAPSNAVAAPVDRAARERALRERYFPSKAASPEASSC